MHATFASNQGQLRIHQVPILYVFYHQLIYGALWRNDWKTK